VALATSSFLKIFRGHVRTVSGNMHVKFEVRSFKSFKLVWLNGPLRPVHVFRPSTQCYFRNVRLLLLLLLFWAMEIEITLDQSPAVTLHDVESRRPVMWNEVERYAWRGKWLATGIAYISGGDDVGVLMLWCWGAAAQWRLHPGHDVFRQRPSFQNFGSRHKDTWLILWCQSTYFSLRFCTVVIRLTDGWISCSIETHRWWRVVVVTRWSYSTPGPVSTWMGDRLRTGTPSRYETSHPGQLSLAIPPWVGATCTSESWGVNRHTARYTSPVSVVSQCKLVSGWGLGKRRSAPPYGPCGSGRTLLFTLYRDTLGVAQSSKLPTSWHPRRRR